LKAAYTPPTSTSYFHSPTNKSRPTTVVVETGVGRRAAPLSRLTIGGVVLQILYKAEDDDY